MEELLRSGDRPTAVFACNDLMAAGVVNACASLGLKVPGDVSVIGFDNTLVSRVMRPMLTTVDLKMEQAGSRAACEIMDMIESGETKALKVIICTRLVIRDSCGSPK
jgi:LacI family transcriptional regulator